MKKSLFTAKGTTVLKRMAVLFFALLLALPASAFPVFACENYTVTVATGYLALRNAKAYDDSNEIGQLFTGDTVQVTEANGTYWTVYSPRLNKSGYVNSNYLTNSGNFRTVSVSSGYLALRTAKAYDSRNEIGELYSGDTVQVIDSCDCTYWYVYSPKYNTCGFVNRNYLY